MKRNVETTLLDIEGFSLSHPGMVRDHNEDRSCVILLKSRSIPETHFFARNDDVLLAAIADGMGGTNAGEVAAAIAIETLKDIRMDFETISTGLIRKNLEEAIMNAHQTILAAGNKENSGMGTTLVIALIFQNSLFVAWSGDSRIYLFSPNEFQQRNHFDLPHLRILTQDHSLVWKLVKERNATPEEARHHESSHIITQCLGDPANAPSPESAVYHLPSGSRILLCSDGLNSMLSDEEIQEIVSHTEPIETIASALVEAANAKGGLDNITVILMNVGSMTQLEVIPKAPVRPEIVTAKSDLPGPLKGASSKATRLLINEKMLTVIILLGIIALLLLMVMEKRTVLTPEKQNADTLLMENPLLKTLPDSSARENDPTPGFQKTYPEDTMNIPHETSK